MCSANLQLQAAQLDAQEVKSLKKRPQSKNFALIDDSLILTDKPTLPMDELKLLLVNPKRCYDLLESARLPDN